MQYVVKMLTLYSYLPSSQTHYFQLLPFSWLCVRARTGLVQVAMAVV